MLQLWVKNLDDPITSTNGSRSTLALRGYYRAKNVSGEPSPGV